MIAKWLTKKYIDNFGDSSLQEPSDLENTFFKEFDFKISSNKAYKAKRIPTTLIYVVAIIYKENIRPNAYV